MAIQLKKKQKNSTHTCTSGENVSIQAATKRVTYPPKNPLSIRSEKKAIEMN